MTFGKKLTLMGTVSIALVALTLLGVALWQTTVLGSRTERETQALISNDIKQISRDCYNTVRCQDESIRDQVEHNMRVATSILRQKGSVGFSGEKTWNATNQLSKEKTSLSLPVMTIGGVGLTGNSDPAVPTTVVDDVQKLVGGVATVFQRKNAKGDMLRVATNVLGANGKRAIGTYIPSANPDGRANPVVAALVRGETYNGMAFVVDEWYVTCYKPLKDASGRVTGALFVGVKQENVSSLRRAIQSTTIGKTGYVWVIGGNGDQKGRYIVSKGGAKGENVWNVKDSQGSYPIQDIVNAAVNLKPNQVYLHRYLWKGPGDQSPQWKLAAVTYYKPWDWVIGASCPESELLATMGTVRSANRNMLWTFAALSICAVLVARAVFGKFAADATSRLQRLMTVADAIAAGNVDAANQMESSSRPKAA